MPRDGVQTVTFMVLIGVGSRYETPRQNGLSHFLEHMFFKGTERRPDKKDIAVELDALGADYNAFTSEEITAYYVKVAMENLEQGADVVSDILVGSLFPAEEIERERGVIIEEINMYTGNPMSHVAHLWNEVYFGNHPLGRRIDGEIETVSKFKQKDFLGYVKQHYHTENTVVAVAGNFDTKKVEQLLGRLFKDLPRGKETKPKKAPAKAPAKRFLHERRASLDQTHLMAGSPGVSLSDEDRWPLEVLATILGGGMSSRMFLSVREEHGLAYTVRTRLESYADTGMLVTQAGLRTDKADFGLKVMFDEFDRVINEDVPDEELEKARQMLRGSLAMQLEETNAMAVYGGAQALLEKKVQSPKEVWGSIKSVSTKDIRRVAKKYLDPKKRSVALLSPHKSTKAFEKLL